MDLSKFRMESIVYIVFKDGFILTGRVNDFTSSWDNDDKGDYLTVVQSAGKLKGLDIQANENEIKEIKVIDNK